MLKYANRLKTYENWPLSFMDKTEMTAGEFYFTGVRDIVRCLFCRVEIGYWKLGDNPFSDHKSGSPDCDFSDGNIPPESDAPLGVGVAINIKDNDGRRLILYLTAPY
jgi:E3 ubiquitin-protein ligase XIAP